MQRATILIMVVGVTFAEVKAQYNDKNLRLDPVTEKYRYENLQLYPIRANQIFLDQHKKIGNYLTLQRALESKKVKITEQTQNEVPSPSNNVHANRIQQQQRHDGAQVNKLFIENLSQDTIIVLSGEVVQGGKQDRMIAQDFILYPGGGPLDVSVFCVEHGRWAERGDEAAFNVYYSISPNNVRKAGTVQKSQQGVWKEVEEKVEKLNVKTSTGTVAALRDADVHTLQWKQCENYFSKAFATQSNIIGVVAVSGDKILGCDLFATHDLFMKYLPNLLNAYSSEAITSEKKITVPEEAVQKYLHNLIHDEARQDEVIHKNGAQLKTPKYKLHVSTF